LKENLGWWGGGGEVLKIKKNKKIKVARSQNAV